MALVEGQEARRAALAVSLKGPVPAALLQREAQAIFSSLTDRDLPGFTAASAFQELLASLGACARDAPHS